MPTTTNRYTTMFDHLQDEPSEVISPDLINKYQEYYNQIVELIKKAKKEKITIGSDPEFFLSSPYTGELVDASDVISDDRNNQPLGLDGHSFTAELRPRPSTNPLTHAKNIEKILSNYLDKNKDLTSFDFYPSALNEHAGGHIGIGHSYAKSLNIPSAIPLAFLDPNSLPKQSEVNPPTQLAIIQHIFTPILEQAREQRYLVSDEVLARLNVSEQLQAKTRDVNASLLSALDLAIGFPLAYIEIPKHAITRKQHYGQLSQYRTQSYGIEYRTPPSWLATKKLTQATLSLAYCVAHDIYYKEKTPPINLADIEGFKESFIRHQTSLLKPFLAPSKYFIRGLSQYPKYKENINYLLWHVERETPLLSHEIKTGWQLPAKFIQMISVLSAKDLSHQLAKTLLSLKNISTNTSSSDLVLFIGYQADIGIKEITNKLNTAFNSILPKTLFNNPQNKLVYLYGKREEKGAYIEVTLPISLIKRKKAQRLHTVLHEVCNSIDYDNLEITNEVEKKAVETLKQGVNIKVGIANQWQFRKGEDLGQMTEKIGAKIGLGLPIRQCPAFLSEMIAFTVLLFVNNTIYKSYQISKKTGKKISLPLLTSTFTKPVKNYLARERKRTDYSSLTDNSPETSFYYSIQLGDN